MTSYNCIVLVVFTTLLSGICCQRIASISVIEATLAYDQNNELDTTTQGEVSAQTTIIDLFVRPNLIGSTKFAVNITTFSTTGENGANLCDNPSKDGVCSIATPVDITIETSPLVQRYLLKERQRIPYLYYHRKFISCGRKESDTKKHCFKQGLKSMVEECKCRDTESVDGSDFRIIFTGNDGRFSFERFDTFSLRLRDFEANSLQNFAAVLNNDFFTNASLYYNAQIFDDDDGTRNFTAPIPAGDGDGDTLFVLKHVYDQSDAHDDDSDPYFSLYVSRQMAPICTVYDIDPIPEQVMHTTITMTPKGQEFTAETLTLSTINEKNAGYTTSGSSKNNVGGSRSFTGRVENTQSATTSYGPTLSGSIVVCTDSQDSKGNDVTNPQSFINTGQTTNIIPDVTQNPWKLAFPPEEGSGLSTSAAGRVFDAETIATLQNRDISEVGKRTRIYYYNNLESLAIGRGCGQIGVANSIYASVPPAISNVVKPSTVMKVPLDVIRGNESFPTSLPTCIPGFGPSSSRDVPLPGRVIANQDKFLYEYKENPDNAIDPPNLPPVYNIKDPNMYFFDKYMYRTADESDVEAEIIITVSGSFLGVLENRADGMIDRDSTYCSMLSENTAESVIGLLSAKVCNSAERIQVDNLDVVDESGDLMSLDETITIDQTFTSQYTLQASCAPESGVAIKSSVAGQSEVLRFTGLIEPGRCERVDFDLALTAEQLGSDSFCTLLLISNEAADSPSNVFLDSVNVPCSLTANYTQPPSLVVDSTTDIIQNFPLPDILDDDDDNLDRVAQFFIYTILFGIPALMLVYIFIVCACYKFKILPEAQKYA